MPLPDVAAAVAEAEYALDVLGADGVKLATNSYGQYLGDEALEPLMAFLNSRKAVIVTHPHKPSAVNGQLIAAVPLASYEYLAETTRAILNLMAHDVLVRYPDLKMVVPHCGSFLPNALPRFKGLLPVMVGQGYMQPIDVDANLSCLYYDLAGAATDDAIESLLTITEPSHILYGSDYPYVAAPALVGAKKSLEARLAAHGLDPQDVFVNNADRLFGTGKRNLTNDVQPMKNVLAPRRQGLAVIAALEAKGDQAGLETALAGHPFDYGFVPATDYYLKAHLFGDIFARDNLSYADREIVTVSAISALPGCEPQLVAHVSGARNMGVTDDELRALPAVLEEKVGHAEAARLRGALAIVLANE